MRSGLLLVAFSFLAAASASTGQLGDVRNISCAGSTCAITASVAGGGAVPLRLQFYAPSIVRWWLAVDGNFSDTGAAADVIVGGAAPVVAVLRDAGAYYEISQAAPATPAVVARVSKSPAQLTILVGGAVVAAEAAPLAWSDADGTSTQTMARDVAPFPQGLSAEHFYGAGMQNGRFAH